MAHQQVSTMLGFALPRAGLMLLALFLGSQLALAAEVGIREDSPSRYTVVQGDTLWDIAGQFLEEPWLWPQVWQINPQIENPDLIYPGDVIELSYDANGDPVLRLSRGDSPEAVAPAAGSAGLPTIRLSPEVRRDAILSPIPAIPLDRISAFLSDNSVISEQEFVTAPYLLAEANGHALIGNGDEVFARGAWTGNVLAYDIVRRGRDLVDPDTGELIGVEALTVGAAELTSVNGDRGTMQVTQSNVEIKPGDRLIPRQTSMIEARYMPTPPPFAVDAAIVSIGTGREIGGLYDSLIINVGEAAGIEPGHLLVVREPPEIVRDTHGELNVWQRFRTAFGRNVGDRLEFPGATVATVLVYRVFEDTSMALVLKSSDAIRLNDRVLTPD